MRWVRLVGTCLLAMLAIGVASTATAAASGPPAWFECRPSPNNTGDYTDKTCSALSKAGSGAFELQEGVGKGKVTKGKSGKTVVHTVIPGKGDIRVECAASKDEAHQMDSGGRGYFFGVKTTLGKCTTLGAPCQSAGAKSGEIHTNTLAGPLGHLSEGSAVGVDLANEATPGTGYLVEFECTGVAAVRVSGDVIAPITGDVATISPESTITYTVGPYLGELAPGYTPLVNIPSFVEGAPSILLTELNGPETGNTWQPEGGLPSGEETVVIDKGEALGIYGEGNVPVERGSVTGTVSDTAPGPVAGALVSVCESGGCYQGLTEGNGSYTISGVADGNYVASVYPPAGSPDNATTSSLFTVSGTAATTEDITLTRPTPVPNGTVVEGNGTTVIGGNVVPMVYWQSESPITTHACTGGVVTATITAVNTSNGKKETTTPVSLTESPPGSGTFSGKLPAVYPLHGEGKVVITVSGCISPSEEESVEFTIYIDPSGTVVDGNHGDAPVSGATVTLLSAESLGGVFTPVENGSVVMSPANRVNPDTSGSNGTFGWDTVPGFYEVQATKPGCGTVTTPAFQVPPPVTNLQLVLHCVQELKVETTALPEATRGVAYSTQLEASGGVTPYKWKKTAALPKGLKLSKTGVLSGTPSTKLLPGAYPIAVKVTDDGKQAKQTATTTLTLEIS